MLSNARQLNWIKVLMLFGVAAVVLFGFGPGPANAKQVRSADAEEVEPYSPRPAGEDPYRVCAPPTGLHASCLAIVDPVAEPERVPPQARNRGGRGTSPASSDASPTICFNCGSGFANGFSPQDLQSAYRLPSLTKGAGQTVAIIGAYHNARAEQDLAVYRETYGLAPCTTGNGCFKKVDQRGGTQYPEAVSPEWSLEMALDVDMVSAACPKCNILVVEADDNSLENLAAATETAARLGADQISNSYASREIELGKATVEKYGPAYQQTGVIVTAGSGDWGYNNENFGSYNEKSECLNCSASFPAMVAGVVAVGGTELYAQGSSGRGWTENVWNQSGSGCALYVAKPTWQKDSSCSTRTNNDVSAVAGGGTDVSVYATVGPYRGWTAVSGTSIGSPLVAAAMALQESSLQAKGVKGIYENLSNWNDVTGGGNKIGIDQSPAAKECATKLLCTAAVGYDAPTGVGTPKGAAATTPPSAVALPARQVTTGAAVVSGKVNPEASAATYRFEYGESTAYGSKTPEGGGSISGYTAASTVTAELKGLKPSTRYHYRIAVESAGGTTYSGDRTFFTAPLTHQYNIESSPSDGELAAPEDVAVGPNGHLWVADTGNDRLLELTQDGELVRTCGTSGSGTPAYGGKEIQFDEPSGIAIEPEWGWLYVSDRGNDRVQVLYPECVFIDAFGSTGSGPGQLADPAGILFGQGPAQWAGENPGELLVADSGNNRIQVFRPKGSLEQIGETLASFGSKGTGNGQFDRPTDIGLDPDNPGQYYVLDSGNGRVQKIKSTWKEETKTLSVAYLSQFGSKGSGAGQLLNPTAIAFDSTSGDLAIADTGNNQVDEFTATGIYVATVGSAGSGEESMTGPKGLGFDPDGTLYIADSGNQRIDGWGPSANLQATTEPATGVSSGVGTLNGRVSTQGETTYQFEYGLTTAYGSKLPAAPQVLGSGAAVPVHEEIEVEPGTTYHYRLVARNGFGVSYGKDETFTAPVWTIQATEEPSGSKAASMIDVSCSSANECIGVGFYTDSSGAIRVMAKRRSGSTKWTSTSAISGGVESRFESVSCASASACTAVGYRKESSGILNPVAQRWIGSGWVLQSVPVPAGAAEAVLRGVSCTSASACTAVGYYKNSGGSILTLAMRWDGSAWTIQTTPNLGNPPKKYLNDVSCASATDCWAAGESVGGLSEPTVALLEHWNGTEWSVQTLSEPPVGLKSISCPTTSSCTAVGALSTERWNGSTWTKGSVAAASGGTLRAIACTSASACTAVGSYTNGYTRPLVENWNGSAWSLQEATDPTQIYGPERTGQFSGVACVSSACSAVGYTGAQNVETRRSLAEGRGGAPVAITNPATNVSAPQVTLNAAVSPRGEATTYQFEYGTSTAYGSKLPASPKSIGSGTTAVDVSDSLGGLEPGTTYHYRVAAVNAAGTAYGKDETFVTPDWAIQASAEPAGSKGSSLADVACTSASECTAVGFYRNSSEAVVTLAERRSGTNEWAQVATPNPSGALESRLESVSCASAGACTAVGYYKNSSGTLVTLAERWDGSSWIVQSTPNPAGATEAVLRGVSCTSASACTAVGYYKNSGGSILTLAMRWDGSAWTIQTTPNPAGNPPKKYLNDVSCASATDCWAAGESAGLLSEGTVALLEHWNGTEWSLQTLAEPPVGMKGISCASTSSCTAVGSLSFLNWNGSSWTKGSTAAVSSGSLRAISCTSASACAAVGIQVAGTGYIAPMVQRWNGSAWSVEAATDTVPVYGGGSEQQGRLFGVSCTSGTACSAVGYRGLELIPSRKMLVEAHK